MTGTSNRSSTSWPRICGGREHEPDCDGGDNDRIARVLTGRVRPNDRRLDDIAFRRRGRRLLSSDARFSGHPDHSTSPVPALARSELQSGGFGRRSNRSVQLTFSLLANLVDYHSLLRRVIELSVEAGDRGDEPFGALLAVGGEIVATARNRVHTDADLTAHAETTLIRKLERDGQLELLSDGVVYASCEPCPMCVGAMFWVGLREVAYSLSHSRLKDLANPRESAEYGFTIGASDIGRSARPTIDFRGPELEEAATAHVGFWGHQ